MILEDKRRLSSWLSDVSSDPILCLLENELYYRVIIVLLFLINRRPSRCLCSSRRWTDTASRESIYCFPSHVIKITPKRYSKASNIRLLFATLNFSLCVFYHELTAITFAFALTDDFPSPPKVCIAFDMLYATCTCFKLINSRYNQFIKCLCGEYKYPCHNIISHVHRT